MDNVKNFNHFKSHFKSHSCTILKTHLFYFTNLFLKIDTHFKSADCDTQQKSLDRRLFSTA